MEKYSSLIRPTFYFTNAESELPEFMHKQISKSTNINFSTEPFIASCWIDNLLGKGRLFVLITQQRVIYRNGPTLQQNLFSDMTGVEKDMLRNTRLLSPGNPSMLFSEGIMPTEKLLDILFSIINEQWIKTRGVQMQPATPVTESGDILAQIEKLAELKTKGILSEDEFTSKKTALLEKL